MGGGALFSLYHPGVKEHGKEHRNAIREALANGRVIDRTASRDLGRLVDTRGDYILDGRGRKIPVEAARRFVRK